MSSKHENSRNAKSRRNSGRQSNAGRGSQSALAEKLDRLAERLQQIGSAPVEDDRGRPTAEARRGAVSAGSRDDYYEMDAAEDDFEERDLDEYAEAFDDGRQDVDRRDWRSAGRHADGYDDYDEDAEFDDGEEAFSEPAYAEAGRRAVRPTGAQRAERPARQAAPKRQAADDQSRRLAAIMGSLDELDARMRDAEDRIVHTAPAGPAERRKASRRTGPSAEEIGEAVSQMSDRRQSGAQPEPVFARGDADERGKKAPSSKRIPRRRASDWNPDAPIGRRADDKTFNEIRSELNALRANMGAQTQAAADTTPPWRRETGTPPQPAAPEVSNSDLADFQDLARRLSRSIEGFDPASIGELRADIAEIRAALSDRTSETSLRTIELGFGDMLQRLDDLSRNTADPRLSRRLESRVEELSRALQSVPQVQHINLLERRLATLSSRFEDVAGTMDPSGQTVIASRLDELRESLRNFGSGDVFGRVETRLGELARQIADVETVAREARGYAADLYDTDRRGIDHLAERLLTEVNSLRTALAEGDSASNVRYLEGRVEALSSKIDQLDGNRQRSFEQLEENLAALSRELPDLASAADGIKTLEQRMDVLTRRLELNGPPDLTPIEGRLSRLEDSSRCISEALVNSTTDARLERLEENTRAIGEAVTNSTADARLERLEESARFIGEAVTNNTTEARLTQLGDVLASISDNVRHGDSDRETLQRIEATVQAVDEAVRSGLGDRQIDALMQRLERLHELVESGNQADQIDQVQKTLDQLVTTLGVGPRQEMIDRLESQIGKLGDRVEGLTDVNTLARMETTIRKLSVTLESGVDFGKLLEVESRMSGIADRFERMPSDAGGPDIALLRQDIAELRSMIAAPTEPDDGLRQDIAALAARIDQFQGPQLGPEQLAQIENQIASLAGRLETSATGGVDLQPVEQRLVEIEGYLGRHNDEAIELARVAARDAVREVALEMAAQQADEPDPVMEELRAQLNALQQSNREDREQHRETLQTVNGALDRIFSKLDGFDEIPAIPAARPQVQPEPHEDFAPVAPRLATSRRSDDWPEAAADRPAGAATGSLADLGLHDPFDDAPRGAATEAPAALPQDDAGEQAAPALDDAPDQAAPTPVFAEERTDDREPPMRPDFGAREDFVVPETDEAPAGGLKRESVSDLRARLFGSPSEEPEQMPEPEPKRRGLLRRKKSADADVTTSDAPQIETRKRRNQVADHAVEPPLTSIDEPGSDTALNGPKLDLDHSLRPDSNTLTSDFQPLSPGSGRPELDERLDDAAHAELAHSGAFDADGEPHDETGGKRRSLLSRVGSIMGRKSGTVAVTAAGALLIAGAMQLRVEIEQGQMAGLPGDTAAPTAEQTATAETPAVDTAAADDRIANVIDHTIVSNAETADEATGVDDIVTGATGPEADYRTPSAAELAPREQPGYPGSAQSFQAEPEVPGETFAAVSADDGQPASLTGQNAISAAGATSVIEPGASVSMALPGEAPLPMTLGTAALRDAAYAGVADAEFQVGYLLLTGKGVPSNAETARSWLEKAAAQNHAPSQFQLGLLHKHGKGTARDPALAQAWFKRAAENGNVMAMHALAVSYSEGDGGAPDYAAAAKWFERAANHGVKDSQFNIALINARGLGVQQDLPASYKWFALAAKQGDSDAGSKRDTIASKLNRQELAQAKLAVDTWKRMEPIKQANSVQIPEAWQQAAAPAKAAPGASSAAVAEPSELLVREAQRLLSEKGYDTGGVDGRIGPMTEEAIRSFQRDVGMEETGKMSPALLRQLLSVNA